LLSELGAQLNTLEWRKGIPSDVDLIIVAGPTSVFTADQVARLWAYLREGGQVLLLADPPSGRSPSLSQASGFFELSWIDLGFRGQDDVVVTEAETLTSGQSQSEAAPGLIANFATDDLDSDHPITANLTEQLAFFGARSLRIDPLLQTEEIIPLVRSDSNFYGEIDYATYLSAGVVEYNIAADTGRDNLILAIAYQNTTTGARLVLVGDREFATNGGGFQTSPIYSVSLVYPDNARFLVNTASWLLDSDAPELTFATPAPTGTATITPSPTVTPTLTITPTLLPTAEE
jgi:hypothetical protein